MQTRSFALALILAVGSGLGQAARAVPNPTPASQNFELGAPSLKLPVSLPGRVRGVLYQDGPGGALSFSRDGLVVSNLYWPDPKLKGPGQFQVDGRTKIHLSGGFRRMLASDASAHPARFLVADLEINQGRGMHGLNGMLVDRCHPIKLDLTARVNALEHQVDGLAHKFEPRIRPFFHQARAGRDLRLTQVTWISAAAQIQVRFARLVSGRDKPSDVGRDRRHFNTWQVPYLTVCYRLRPDGRVISRAVVPPGDPLTTARNYNPGGSPW